MISLNINYLLYCFLIIFNFLANTTGILKSKEKRGSQYWTYDYICRIIARKEQAYALNNKLKLHSATSSKIKICYF